MRFFEICIIFLGAALAAGCGSGSDFLSGGASCGPYTAPSQSPYVLPYPVGQSFLTSQGNCGTYSHTGDDRYAYDFAMPIGTTIVATRAGTVLDLIESNTDDNGGISANFVRITHSDGTIAIYAHLTKDGVVVSAGASVTQGQSIALSGNSGYSSAGHLHFEVFQDANSSKSVPVTFSNASPNPNGPLKTDSTYSAL